MQEIFINSNKSLLLIYHTEKEYFILQGVGKLPSKDLQKAFVRFRVQAKRKGVNKLLINFHDVNSFGLRQVMNLFSNYLFKSAKQDDLYVALIIANPESYSKSLMKLMGFFSKLKYQLFESMPNAETWLLAQQMEESIAFETLEEENQSNDFQSFGKEEEGGIEYFEKEEKKKKEKTKQSKKERELRSFSLGKGLKVRFKVVNEKKKWWQYFLE